MLVARVGDAAAVIIARLVQPAELFERLSAVEICRGVRRIVGDHGREFVHGAIEITGVDQLHGQSIAGKRIGRVLLDQLLEDFETCKFQLL